MNGIKRFSAVLVGGQILATDPDPEASPTYGLVSSDTGAFVRIVTEADLDRELGRVAG